MPLLLWSGSGQSNTVGVVALTLYKRSLALTLYSRSLAFTLYSRSAGKAMATRSVVQGRQVQGEAESIAYTVDVTNWGSSPSAPSAEALDVTAGNTVVTSTVLTGLPSVLGNVVTTPVVANLQAGHLYRIEVSFVISGNTEECYFEVMAED